MYKAYLREIFPSEYVKGYYRDFRALCGIFRFLESEEYRHWVCSALGISPNQGEQRNAESTGLLLGIPRIKEEDFRRISADLNNLVGNLPECWLFFTESDWFRHFVELAEGLPACVSLSIARGGREGIVIYANRFTYEGTGYVITEVIGRKSLELRDTDGSLEKIQQAVDRNAPVRAMVSCQRKNGSAVPSILISKPLFNSHGECKFVITATTDVVTEEMNAIIGNFIANIPNVVCYD